MMVVKTPCDIKNELVEAITEVSWVVESGDAHDLQDACDLAHESMDDALAYIKQLEAERDAAVADLAHVKDCDTCKYDNACLTGKKDCFGCHAKSCPCLICQYEWRGVQKEE